MKGMIAITAAMILAALPLAAQNVKVVAPNGGESWALNSAHDITWTFQNAGSVKVDIVLRSGSTRVGVIKSQVALAAGSWTWTSVGRLENGTVIPAGTAYTVRIRDAANTFGDSSDNAFAIVTAVKVVRPLPERLPAIENLLKAPRLEVTEIGLAPNVEGFGVVFNYRNVGNGALPKAAESSVKPDFRVLIDGRETASGSLFIPGFAAQPGWEQKGFFGGWIVLPNAQDALDKMWFVGNMIEVRINENRALGMGSHSLTLPLKPIAMKYKYDLVCNGISLDWSTRMLKVSLRLDGKVPAGREVFVYCGRQQSDDSYFMVKQPARPGSFVVSKKVDFPQNNIKVILYLNSYVTIPSLVQAEDMDYRNNFTMKCEFKYPDPNPII